MRKTALAPAVTGRTLEPMDDTTDQPSLRMQLRGQRAELVVAIALMVIVGVSAIVAINHLAGASPSEACWNSRFADTPDRPRTLDPGVEAAYLAVAECRRTFSIYFDLQGSEVGKIISLAIAAPFIVGLLLGIPVGARAPTGDGSSRSRRELASRILVMLAVVVGGLTLTTFLVTLMWTTAEPWTWGAAGPGRTPSLDHIAFAPLSFVARGVLAFGVGLLVGAIVRRTLVAYLIASLILVVAVMGGAWGLHAVVADSVAVWRDRACASVDRADDDCEEPPWLYYLGTGFRDTDGSILSAEQAEVVRLERCPTCRDDGEDWIQRNLVEAWRVAPTDSIRTFEAAEAVVWSGLGLLCIVLTFPVLSWHRRRERRAYRTVVETPAPD